MKRILMISVAAVLLAGAVGCEKNAQDTQTISEYEAGIDGPPAMYAAPADDSLLKDQTKVVAATATPTPTTGPATTGPAATAGDPVADLKQYLSAIDAAVKAGDKAKVFDMLPPAEAKTFSDLFAAAKSLPPKVQAFTKLLQDKSIPVPAELKDAGNALFIEGALKTPDLSKATYKQESPTVVIVTPEGETPGRFVKGPTGWKMQLDPAEAKMMGELIPVFRAVMTAQEQVIGQVTAKLNDGSITAANFDVEFKAIAEKVLKPAMEKMASAMGGMMKEAVKGMGEPATAPTTAPTTPPEEPGTGF